MDALNKGRIVILGKTGSGKSSVANTILGEDKFNVWHSSTSAESPCEAITKSLNGKEITLIDTPGLFDTNKPEEDMKPEIVKCITECSPGPHAFLIVLQLGRFTEQENDIIKKITQYFSEEVFNFATVVFTHGDDLQEGQTIKDYVISNPILNAVVKKCGGRCHVIDNKYWKNPSGETFRSNAYQVKEILKSVEEIVNANNGNCYTNEMLQAVEEMTKQEEERIALTPENMSREEIRRKAKSRVCDILNKAAGITTGALLGGLFGVIAEVADAVRKLAVDLSERHCKPGAAAGTAGVTGGGIEPRMMVGAVKGYKAAEESETPWETILNTAEAVYSSGKNVLEELEEFQKINFFQKE